ncbi:MAG: adenylyl-sulfate kinase [bacterium]
MQNSPKSKNLSVEQSSITHEEREAFFKQIPVTFWFTGLSGSGKSTLTRELERAFFSAGRAVYSLDGDNIRKGLNMNLGFSKDDRKENIRRIAQVAHLFNDAGLISLTAFISPFRDDRRLAREVIGEKYFIEVFLDTPLEVCEKRDPKGLYKKARKGEIPEFTGISSPYEPPQNAEIVLNTAELSIEECIRKIMNFWTNRKLR